MTVSKSLEIPVGVLTEEMVSFISAAVGARKKSLDEVSAVATSESNFETELRSRSAVLKLK
ncbi:uncharacterized protein CCR75_000127 [Bremia lactucae]|uniref:Uncharacterized protein n=1 Tax=Bremia lactucae TaxID=4779 RepID=A0A976IHS4_BRELC|nr:hypothetical protein CCR75_000127 [Bremia lactucae]